LINNMNISFLANFFQMIKNSQTRFFVKSLWAYFRIMFVLLVVKGTTSSIVVLITGTDSECLISRVDISSTETNQFCLNVTWAEG